VSATGGTGNYTILLSNQNNAYSGNSMQGIAPGLYELSITDANSCEVLQQVAVTEPAALGLEIIQHNNISCYGFSDGSLEIAAWGGTAPLQVSLFNNEALYFGTQINGINAGSYTLQIEDANGCRISESVIFTQPQPLVLGELSSEEISCAGYNDGVLQVQASGGTSPLSATLTGLQNTYYGFNINNIAAGVYNLTVNDINGCFVEQNVVFEAPAPLLVSDFTLEHVSCYGLNDGSLLVSATGGTGNYTILLSNQNNAYSGNSMQGIAPGLYELSITDANSCEVLQQLTVTEPELLEMEVASMQDISCFGLDNGSLEVEVSGGTAPLEVELSSALNTYYGTFISNIIPGEYTLNISDANGCLITESFQFQEPEPLEIALAEITAVTCHGLSNGSISISATGGFAPYSVTTVSNGIIYSGFQLSSLSGGEYAVTVSDNNGCEASDVLTLIEPEALTIASAIQNDITCYGLDNGSLMVTAQGGTAPLSSTLQGTNGSYQGFSINGIAPGSYTLTIEDANGCEITEIRHYIEPPLLQIANFTAEEITCFGYSDGTLSVLAQGGTPPLSCAMYNTNLAYTGFIVQNIAPGIYQVIVEDANGCEVSQQVNYSNPQPLVASLTGGDVICPGESTPLTVLSQGGSGEITYQWNQGLSNSPNHVVSPTATSQYSVNVIDSNGCVAGPLTTIVEVMVLTQTGLNMSEDTGICPGSPAEVSAEFTGNYGPYSFDWTQGLGAQPGTFTVYPQNDTWYKFTVYDVCNNSLSDSIFVTVHELPEISLPGNIASGCIPVTVDFSDYVENVPGSTYNWNFGDGYFSFQADPTHNYDDPGIFNASVLITTPEGCVVESSGMGTISAFGIPEVSIITEYTSTTLENPNFTLFAASDAEDTGYQWYESAGEFTTNDMLEVTYADTGTYYITLVGVNEYGCADSEVIALEIIPVHDLVIPNIFTPNTTTENDGYYNPSALNNDIFYPFTEYVKEFEMLIFNRWGELVFESHDLAYGWNGYYRGQLCQQDVYVYKLRIEYTDGIVATRMGDITLMR
jgi:gliding motility-associated-like protein